MVRSPRPKTKSPLPAYLIVALLSWGGLIFTILRVEPGTLLSYLTFFGLLTLVAAWSSLLIYASFNQFVRKKRSLVTSRGQRRVWLVTFGIVALGVLQLFRLTSWFNLILIAVILLLIEIYTRDVL